MPITPRFTISEPTMTQIELQIHVPHVRFSVEEIQISLSHHNTTLHFYCPPIYLLVLNFAPYQFRHLDEDDDDDDGDGADIDVVQQDDEEEKEEEEEEEENTVKQPLQPQPQQPHRATYLPHVQNGMIQLIFEKHVNCQYHWENIDLLGKLQQPSSSSQQQQSSSRMTTHDIFAAAGTGGSISHPPISSVTKLQWLREIVNEEDEEAVDESEHDDDDDNTKNNNTSKIALEQTSLDDRISPPSTTTITNTTGTYGFDRMFAHIYDDLQRENSIMTQMLECPWSDTTTIFTYPPPTLSNTTNTTTTSSRQTLMDVKIIDTDEEDDSNHHNFSMSVTSIHRQRRQQRKEMYENQKFNVERYIQDIDIEECQDFIYDHAMTTIPHWKQSPLSPSTDTDGHHHNHPLDPNQIKNSSSEYFTSSERQLLMSIPYPLLDDVSILQPPVVSKVGTTTTAITTTPIRNERQNRHQWSLAIGLIDVLYAYVYDHLTTIDHEPTVESAWTISTLSISLSWLHDWLDDDHDTTANDSNRDSLESMVQSVVQSSIRRSLIYPYIRNFSFSIYIWEQVVSILQNTKPDSIRIIIRCLLQVRNILNFSDIYYLGNKLYIDPYLIWIQKYNDTNYLQQELLSPIAQCILQHINNDTSIHELKHDLDLNLLQIEAEFYNNDDDDNYGVLDEVEADECATKADHNTSSDEDDETSDDENDDESDDDGDDHGTCSRSCAIFLEGEKTRTLVEGDQRPNKSFDDVDAAARGIQSLELLSKEGPNANSPNVNCTNTKTSVLDNLLSICTSFESLNTDVNTAAVPLIQEIE